MTSVFFYQLFILSWTAEWVALNRLYYLAARLKYVAALLQNLNISQNNDNMINYFWLIYSFILSQSAILTQIIYVRVHVSIYTDVAQFEHDKIVN